MDMSAKQFIEFLPELVRTQKVPEQLINPRCRRALELKFRLGLFDNHSPILIPNGKSRHFILKKARKTHTKWLVKVWYS